MHISLLRKRIVIQASNRGGGYTFFFSMEGSVYLNIRGDVSVIQASLKENECNLLFNFYVSLHPIRMHSFKMLVESTYHLNCLYYIPP